MPQFDPSIPRSKDEWRVISGDNRNELNRRAVKPNEPLLRLGVVDGPDQPHPERPLAEHPLRRRRQGVHQGEPERVQGGRPGDARERGCHHSFHGANT